MELETDEEQVVADAEQIAIARQQLSTIWSAEEEMAYDALSEAFNRFVQLEVLHPADRREFAEAINKCKNIIMSRPVARCLQIIYSPHVGRGGYAKLEKETNDGRSD